MLLIWDVLAGEDMPCHAADLAEPILRRTRSGKAFARRNRCWPQRKVLFA